MANGLRCKVCKKKINGISTKLYCSKNCTLYDRRKKRKKIKDNSKTKEEKNREASKKYYLKHKYLLTKKYKKEQKEKEKRKRENNKRRKNSKEKVAEYGRRARRKARKWFDDYKETLECESCGYDKCSGALDFHHKNEEGKEFNISVGLYKFGKKRVLKEIEKCIVLCSNCHRELHYKEKQEEYKRKKQEYLKIVEKEEKKAILLYYKIVEKEFKTEWFKELQDRIKYNSSKFNGNQYVRRDNRSKEKIDTKMILSEKTGIPPASISKIIQIYNRGTEDQKRRAREGIDFLNKIYHELEPTRYSKNFPIKYEN